MLLSVEEVSEIKAKVFPQKVVIALCQKTVVQLLCLSVKQLLVVRQKQLLTRAFSMQMFYKPVLEASLIAKSL